MNALAKKLARDFLKDDSEVEARIKEGIESNRKGFGEIELVDAKGKPVEKASIKLSLKRHEYHFGCNLFMLGQFKDKEQNAAYEETFKEIFNLAVVPLYWSDLEPRDGELRFGKDSVPVYRRPATDACLEYCERNGITPKGHPLLWHHFWPSWLKGTKQELESRIARRFREIAERYSDKIKVWDVVNEAQSWTPDFQTMPDAHVDLGFKLAGQLFPGSTLTYNDDNKWWDLHGEYTPVYLLVRHLLDKGLPVNAVGFQYHMFESLLDQSDRFMSPTHLFKCLDQYAKLGLPLNLSEISVISRRDLGDGDEFQALVTERLYRLWFSHASTNGAVWWNMVDGTAAYAPMGSEEGENSLRAGLVNYDFTPKKAFSALKRLIKEEWTTNATMSYETGATNKFRGFHGDYDVVVETSAGTFKKTLKLSKYASSKFKLALN